MLCDEHFDYPCDCASFLASLLLVISLDSSSDANSLTPTADPSAADRMMLMEQTGLNPKQLKCKYNALPRTTTLVAREIYSQTCACAICPHVHAMFRLVYECTAPHLETARGETGQATDAWRRHALRGSTRDGGQWRQQPQRGAIIIGGPGTRTAGRKKAGSHPLAGDQLHEWGVV